MIFIIRKVRQNKADYPIIAETELKTEAKEPMVQVFEAIDHGYTLWAPEVPAYQRTVHTTGFGSWGADLFDGEHIIEVSVLEESKKGAEQCLTAGL